MRYYKIDPSSELFDKFEALLDRGLACRDAAIEEAEKIEGSDGRTDGTGAHLCIRWFTGYWSSP